MHQDSKCDGKTGPKQRIGDTSCIDTTTNTTSIWISEITKEERKICLRRFTEAGCDTANEELPQLLTIRECRLDSDSSATFVLTLIFSQNFGRQMHQDSWGTLQILSVWRGEPLFCSTSRDLAQSTSERRMRGRLYCRRGYSWQLRPLIPKRFRMDRYDPCLEDMYYRAG